MINTIQELKDFLGESHTIAYHHPNAKYAMVDNKDQIIKLPITKEDLLATLKKEVVQNEKSVKNV